MKKIKLALEFGCMVLILLIFSQCFSQAIHGANRIIVSNEQSARDNLDVVIKEMINQGYEPTEINKEYFTVKTSLKGDEKADAEYYFFVTCREGEIIIYGQFKSTITISSYGVKSEASFRPIENRGMKGSTLKITFNKMDELARALPSESKIRYDIK